MSFSYPRPHGAIARLLAHGKLGKAVRSTLGHDGGQRHGGLLCESHGHIEGKDSDPLFGEVFWR
jgi:hypothetical protein